MIVSHLYLKQPVSGENVTISAEVTVRFSQHQLILHVHMSQPAAAFVFGTHFLFDAIQKKSMGEMNGRKTARPR